MILDQWDNRQRYITMHPLFKKGFAFIEEYLEQPLEPGIYEIDGAELFAKVQSYNTRVEGYYETHDNYIDIQYMVEGRERVFYCDKKELQPIMDYDVQEDAWFFGDGDEFVEFILVPGRFAIFFPEDAHKPAMALEEIAGAQKVVLKVRV